MIWAGLAGGLVIGVISGMVGIGGGALIVPLLVYGMGMTQLRAQGTSLAVLLPPIGALALWKYWQAGNVDLKLALMLALGFAVGAWFGGGFAQHVPEVLLRRMFGVLMMGIALRMIVER